LRTRIVAAVVLAVVFGLAISPALAFNYDISFWLSRSSRSYDLLASGASIDSVNAAMARTPAAGIVDLLSYPADVDAFKLADSIVSAQFPKDLYLSDGTPAPAGLISQLQAKFKPEDAQPWYKARYGVAVMTADLRSLPAADRLYAVRSGGTDLLQAGRMLPAEPCVILAETKDKAWLYVQTARSCGWVASLKVAVAFTREHWLSYINAKEFAIVTAPSLRVEQDDAVPALDTLEFPMGTKIPLMPAANVPAVVRGRASADSFAVLLPVRRADGKLQVVSALIPRTSDVFAGYLPLTGENILKQSMKLVGTRYGYMGSSGRDPYVMASDIFRCFGLELPMSLAGWEAAPLRYQSLKGESSDMKLLALRKSVPGAILLGNQGPSIFLGQYGDDVYAIAALAAVKVQPSSELSYALEPLPYNGIGLISLKSIYADSGNDLFSELRAVIEPIPR